jgi:hypothetical protein
MTSPTQLLDDASLQPAPSPRRPLGPLTFRSPDDEGTTPWDEKSPATGEGSPLDPPAGSPSVSDESSAPQYEDDESDPRSSRASSADPASVRPLTAKAQAAAARQAVKIAGSMAHQYLARDEAAKAVGLFLVDDETAEQIGDPLARIMARHAPIDGGIANPDVADGIAAMLGVANFVSKTVIASSQAAALRNGVQTEQPRDV